MNFSGIIIGLATFLIIGIFDLIVVDIPSGRNHLRCNFTDNQQYDHIYDTRSDGIFVIMEHSRVEGAEKTRRKGMVSRRSGTQEIMQNLT